MTKNTTPVTEDTPGAEFCGGPCCEVGYFIPTKRNPRYCSRACAERDAREYERDQEYKWSLYNQL